MAQKCSLIPFPRGGILKIEVSVRVMLPCARGGEEGAAATAIPYDPGPRRLSGLEAPPGSEASGRGWQ